MSTITFPEITYKATKHVPCTGCGKKITRRQTFSQTVNPWNRNGAGDQKTVEEIRVELHAKAAAWTPTATCPACTPVVPATPIKLRTITATQTEDLLSALDTVIAVMRSHSLAASGVHPRGGGDRFHIDLDLDGDLPMLLRWATHLNVDTINVERGSGSRQLTIRGDYENIRLRLYASVYRPEGDPLPGITIDWKRTSNGRRGNVATITAEDLRATLIAMGYPPEDAD
ncbi:hypothetical protein [Kutzneria albida]|uniref:Uncharacterized protein n=1 Tax=Kutzneria albida DSM 43870 TaxID=1449976 RepID=W5WCJ5_9PSEU|nr:hypothetical protein [Kutzneria albida]AHH98256.1 hypothetical protein KALB_4894 [Kutzneria albida DSM 43870]